MKTLLALGVGLLVAALGAPVAVAAKLSPLEAHFPSPGVRSIAGGTRERFSLRAPAGAVRAVLIVRANGVYDLRDHGRRVDRIEREVAVRRGRATITLPKPTGPFRHNYEQRWLDAEGRLIRHSGTARGDGPALGTARWDSL